MPLLAVDDTDTRQSGCTTHTAHEIAVALEQATGALAGWGLSAPPRLVRLNPAARHRTRGNGALVLPLARKAGPRHVIGHAADGTPITVDAAPHEADEAMPEAAARQLEGLVTGLLPDPGSPHEDPQPAAILVPSAPDAALYRAAVARMVSATEAWQYAPPGTRRLTPAHRRGEIGALAAAAWQPTSEARWSWEQIAYRADATLPRDVPAERIAAFTRIPGAFDNVDPKTGRVRAIPRTPCPILYAVRGTDPAGLLGSLCPDHAAAGTWLLQTNQASGDHARYAPSTPTPYGVVRARATIDAPPRRGPGGHLFAPALLAGGAAVTLAAFEPTKGLRHALAETRRGDVLQVLARSGADVSTLHLEAFRVEELVPRVMRGPPPRCVGCKRSMKSRGRDSGHRCPGCGARTGPTSRITPGPAPVLLQVGATHQVPDHVRGHLLPPVQGLEPARGLFGTTARAVLPALSDDEAHWRTVFPAASA